MTENFYYLGILYIIYNIIKIYEAITDGKEDVDESMDTLMPDGMTADDMKEKAEKSIIGIIPSTIWSLFNIAWIISGLIHTEEAILFFAILSIPIYNILNIIWKLIIRFTIKRDELESDTVEMMTNYKEYCKKMIKAGENPNKTKIQILKFSIKICLTIAILYHHFFIS